MSLAPARAQAQAPRFTSTEFRAALGAFATGVTIVTTCTSDGRPVGLTANSFNSVSLTPPLVLWSLSRLSGSMQAFQQNSHYAVHVLGHTQQALAQRFATRDIDRFEGLEWTPGAGGAPLLAGCAATFTCFNRSRYAEGDHVIFIGEVEHCSHSPTSAPLLYHGGRFHPHSLQA
jgi:flavin reductase (DIM6/NTAB) family NADH-FMN oxidoreductase RutF